MIVVKETDEMATLAEAAKAYQETKDAHDAASKVAKDAVLAALKAGYSIKKVTEEGPFTYAYVRSIAAKNDIPRDERKARYRKNETGAHLPAAQVAAISNPLFMSASDRDAELIAMGAKLPPGRYVELVSWLEQHHWGWLRTNRKPADSDWNVVQKAIKAGLITTSQLV